MEGIQTIQSGDAVLAYVIRAGATTQRTHFITDDEAAFQIGFIVKDPGESVPRHEHKPIQRHLTTTSEALLLREGTCEVDVYSGERERVATIRLGSGDVILFLGGGHEIRTEGRTVFLEVKQGPYPGTDEKNLF